MKRNKIRKGEKGYLEYQKRAAIFRTAALFALSLAVFLTGFISTGQKENLLTIVAVLGCLPASRSAVGMIMTMKFHGISKADFSKIEPHIGSCVALCDLAFTSYERNYEIHHMAYKSDCLIGYTANSGCDAKKCEKHLHDLCVQNRLGDVNIKIFKELPKYINRLDQLQSLPDSGAEEEGTASRAELVCALMRAVSL